MATVTGLTAARMLAIEAASVVSGAVDGSGHLQLETEGGSTIDAGNVIGPAGPTGAGFGSSVIAQTTDLNTVVTPGSYVQLVDAWATFALHYPQVGDGGWLMVMGTGSNRIQTYIAPHNSELPSVYYRETSDTGAVWTAWRPMPMSNDSGAYRFIRDGYDNNVRVTAGGSIDSFEFKSDTAPGTPGRPLWLNANSGGHVYIGKTGETTRTIELRMATIAALGLTSAKKMIFSTDTTTDSCVEFGNGSQVRVGGTAGGVMLQRAGDTGNFIFVTDDGARQARIQAAYDRTTASAANVVVTSNGTLQRSTSLRADKVNLEDAPEDWAEKMLNLRPRTWTDRNNLDRYSRALEREIAGEEIDWSDLDVQQINERIPGLVAEEVVESGLDIFATKDANGELNGVAYDRVAVGLLALVQNQQEQINELKTLVTALLEGQ